MKHAIGAIKHILLVARETVHLARKKCLLGYRRFPSIQHTVRATHRFRLSVRPSPIRLGTSRQRWCSC